MRHFISTLFLFLVVASQAERPNILFIYTDDQGAWTVGASGNPQAHTPNIDRIYNEGVVFKNAFVHSPVCSPARATLLTSRHGTEQMILDWIRPGGENWLGCDPTLPTWPRALKQAGYNTALIGKWHLGIPDKFHPTHFGYDHFMGHRAGGWSAADPTLEKNGKSEKCKGLTEDILATETIDYIQKHVSEPWAVSLHFRAPHTAWLPVGPEDGDPHQDTHPNFVVPHPDLEDFDNAKFQASTRDYYSSVSCVDRNVGRVMKCLEDLGLDEKTLIIFSSDHGYNVGHYGLWSKGNAQRRYIPTGPQEYVNFKPLQRPNLYDTSIRVPCALRWKGTIKSGRTLENFVMNSDWFATLCDAAQTKAPKGIRGKSFWPLVMGETRNVSDDIWYGEWDMRQGAFVQMRAIRTPEWKFIVDFLNEDMEGNRRGELYNLKRDPQEINNVFDHPEYQGIREQLMQKLLGEMRKIDPPKSNRHAININFASNNRYDLLPPGKTAGVVGTGIWNNFNPGMAGKRDRIYGLIDCTGAFTTASLHCTSDVTISNNTRSDKTLMNPNELMMQGWVGLNEHDDSLFQISDIPAALIKSGYDLYIYSDSDASGAEARSMTFSINGESKTVKEPEENFSTVSKLEPGVNFVVFSDLNLSTITIDARSSKGRAAINAIQIVGK